MASGSGLHLGDRADPGGEVNLDFKAGPPPTMTISMTDTGRPTVRTVKMTRAEIENTLDKLEPWLVGHVKRLI